MKTPLVQIFIKSNFRPVVSLFPLCSYLAPNIWMLQLGGVILSMTLTVLPGDCLTAHCVAGSEERNPNLQHCNQS